MADCVALVTWAIETPSVSGAVNVTSPEPVPNAEFSRALGKAMRRPSWLPAPAFALRILFGEVAPTMLVAGQRVVPKRAQEAGFAFKYPEINSALAQALSSGV
jgi:NAD dependent epimerase/dehydratase family enzyme